MAEEYLAFTYNWINFRTVNSGKCWIILFQLSCRNCLKLHSTRGICVSCEQWHAGRYSEAVFSLPLQAGKKDWVKKSEKLTYQAMFFKPLRSDREGKDEREPFQCDVCSHNVKPCLLPKMLCSNLARFVFCKMERLPYVHPRVDNALARRVF